MHFDIIFVDYCANKYYDRQTLEKQALGGTEATAIRIAEGLGSLGLKVAIVQSRVEYFEPTMGQHCFFLHSDDMPDLSCMHYVQMRENKNPQLFPKSKHYLWLHDVANNTETKYVATLKETNTQVIGVSRWHKRNIQDYMPGYNEITYIHNPVEEHLYVGASEQPDYKKDLMIWTASPHKGLGHALEVFKDVRKSNPKMQLIVTNPGYHQIDVNKVITMPGVVLYGNMPCRPLWQLIKKCLCVFYPSDWPETFGLVAAEANALGVPLVTYRRGALKEIVSSDDQFVEVGDDAAVVRKVTKWNEEGRPRIVGKDEFKFSKVILKWVELLGKR